MFQDFSGLLMTMIFQVHRHAAAVNCLLFGLKKWFLFPPVWARFSALSVYHSELYWCGSFVWACGRLTSMVINRRP